MNSACRFDLEVCGGTFVDAPCVVDGNLVSGRSWHDHGHYMKPWIEMLIAERERMSPFTADRLLEEQAALSRKTSGPGRGARA